MRTAFVNTLEDSAALNDRIMLLTGDLGFGVFDDFARRFPSQFLNVGVAEQNMMGVACGLALEGHKVFAYSIANFATLRCLEQIRNDIAYHDADVKIVAVGGGFSYGALGVSHHATEDLAIMRSLPGLTVVAPGDAWETGRAVRALANSSGPAYLRLDRSGRANIGTDYPTADAGFTLGSARTIRDGRDLCIIATGGILGTAVDAAADLERIGIECRVISMHTIKPIDTVAIAKAAAETHGILTLEEHSVDGGLGGAIAEVCLEAGMLPRRFYRMGLRAGFSSIVGSQEYLRARYDLDKDAVIKQVQAMLRS